MNQPTSIVLLSHSDSKIADLIYSIFQKSYAIEAALIGVDTFPPLERSIKAIENSKTTFWGLYVNDKLASVAEIVLENRLLDIHSFVVSPSFFRQGIGSKLLNHLLSSIKFDSAVVETASVNKPAIALYKKFGFIESKTWQTSIGIEKVMLKLK